MGLVSILTIVVGSLLQADPERIARIIGRMRIVILPLFALIFLVVIHKLEYFLNSKIIGDRIKNPMWLTLIGLVIGEKLMGVPGMILAPVVLHYIKVEASRNKVESPPHETPEAAPVK